jgi:hypothetical protein
MNVLLYFISFGDLPKDFQLQVLIFAPQKIIFQEVIIIL